MSVPTTPAQTSVHIPDPLTDVNGVSKVLTSAQQMAGPLNQKGPQTTTGAQAMGDAQVQSLVFLGGNPIFGPILVDGETFPVLSSESTLADVIAWAMALETSMRAESCQILQDL